MAKWKVISILFLGLVLLSHNNYCFSQEGEAEKYVELGNASFKERKWVLALGYFKNALDIDRKYKPAIEGLSKVYNLVRTTSVKDASELVDMFLEEYPEWSDQFYLALASNHQSEGFNEKALEILGKIKNYKDLSPFPPEFYYVVKSNAYVGIGEVSKARQELEDALLLFPNSAILHSSIANVYALDNENQKAIYHYRKAIELKPDIKDADQIRQKIESLENII